jgi:hypothetical protein
MMKSSLTLTIRSPGKPSGKRCQRGKNTLFTFFVFGLKENRNRFLSLPNFIKQDRELTHNSSSILRLPFISCFPSLPIIYLLRNLVNNYLHFAAFKKKPGDKKKGSTPFFCFKAHFFYHSVW